MLYPKNKESSLSADLFKNPTSEYRATPFWAWNGELKSDLLEKQIESLKEMGFGGFHMHVRVGLSTPYLSDEFMKCVSDCVNKAKKENMYAWLYDEDRWPSGFAGGLNTKKEENRQKFIKFTKIPYNDDYLVLKCDKDIATNYVPQSKYSLLQCFDIIFDANKKMVSYEVIDIYDRPNGEKWFAYLETAKNSPYYGGYTYCDTLKKSTIEDFIEITHEKYKSVVGDEFGKTVPAIFCDEPGFALSESMTNPDEDKIIIAYTDDFDVTFQKEYGYSIMDRLPEVVFESSDGKLSQARYAFHNHRTDRFVEAFSDTIGEWCDKNNLNMTGHFFREPSLNGQTTAVGDVMRSYRAFSIPGIDMLSDKHEISCVKQCQSSVRQYGREGMTSELYGVTTWEFDFRGHKQQGDWQAAMGVTVRVPHLFWMSMKGDAKRDYPASIGYQSPWYKEYKYIEDHFARVNTAMTRGKPVVRIGVIHPIESYWLYYGPYSQTSHARRELANRYYELINWFVFGSLDFDMICEANLQSQYVESSDGFTVGCEKYDMIVVPGLTTIRSATLDLLEKFVARGGKVVFMGDVPAYVDANESSKALELAQKSISIDWSRRKLFDLAEEYRDIKILDGSCEYASNLTYNMRDDNGIRRVFIAHVVEPKRYEYDSTDLEKYTIQLKGEWKVTLLNTLDGNKYEVAAKYVNGETIVTWVCGCCDSLLIELEPGKRTEGIELKVPSYSWSGCIEDSAEYSLEEQNVMLLDMPRFSFDNGELNESEEILRVSDKAKIHFDSLTLKGWQPWMKPRSKEPKGVVKLVYEFESEIDCSNVQLALENIEYSQVTFNGIKSDMVDRGYYVDEDAIRVINVSNIKKGTNLLEIEIKYNDTVCIESCYLLGNFGVNIIGGKAKVVELPKKLVFDNVVNQGLAFYSGNITYHLKYTGAGNKAIGIHRFKGAAISVDVDGERVQGMVSFPPNVLNLGLLKDGEHNIDVTVYGNRWNTFGPLHDSYVKPSFPSPEVYKRPNRWFVREYQVHPFGILTTPVIMDK